MNLGAFFHSWCGRAKWTVFVAMICTASTSIFGQPTDLIDNGAQEQKIKTLVFGLQARRNIEPDLALAVSDVVQGELSMDKTRTVIGRSEIERLLEYETEKQLIGCVDDSCLAEIASAMNVERIISGTMDKVGSSYFVIITELDAINVTTVARVQQRLPLNEDSLFEGIQRMTQELMRQSGSPQSAQDGATGKLNMNQSNASETANSLASQSGNKPGTLSVSSVPPGMKVLIGGELFGTTPLMLEAEESGQLNLQIKRAGDRPMELEVPVELNKETDVAVTLNFAPEPTAEEVEAFESDNFYNKLIGCGACGCGAGCCLSSFPVFTSVALAVVISASTGSLAGQATSLGALSGSCAALVPFLAGCAGTTCGGYRLLWGGPEDPTENQVPVDKIEVTPPNSEDEILEYLFERKNVAAPKAPGLRSLDAAVAIGGNVHFIQTNPMRY
jgi:hypothetical protein